MFRSQTISHRLFVIFAVSTLAVAALLAASGVSARSPIADSLGSFLYPGQNGCIATQTCFAGGQGTKVINGIKETGRIGFVRRFAGPDSSFGSPNTVDVLIQRELENSKRSVLMKALLTASAGDYRSAASGNWNSTSTWERFDGVSWIPAVLTPTNADGVITVQSGHTVTISASVTYDQVVVESGGQVTVAAGVTHTLANGAGTDLVINGTWLNQGGTWTVTGTAWTLANGGTFIHNTGSAILAPLDRATLEPNSTFIYRRTTSNPGISASGRTYGNLILESLSGTYAAGVSGSNPMFVNGNFEIGSNVTLTNGLTGNVNFAGNFTNNGTLANSTFDQIYNFTGSSKSIGGTGAIEFETLNIATGAEISLGRNVTIAAGFAGTISGSLNCGAFTVSGGGNFILASGGTLGIGSTGGIASSGSSGNIQNSGSRSFNTSANYVYNGSVAQITGSGLPASVSNLTFANTGGNAVTLGSNVIVSGTASVTSGILRGHANITGPLTVASGATVAPGVSPGILGTGNVSFASGSTLDIEIGGTTPGNLATNHDQLNVTGTVDLGSATLNLASFNGFVPTVGDSFTIINTNGADEITGTFAGLAEGATIFNFLGSGLNATISYMGGDSNEVVLTAVVQPTPPTLGTYPKTTVDLSDNATILPVGNVAPTDTTSITVSAPTSFIGELTADPVTGSVRVTNAAHANIPPGTYPVTVTAFGPGGTATATFDLTVTSGTACIGSSGFSGMTNVSVGDQPISVAVGDFNGDGIQDIAAANYSSNTVSIRLGDGLGAFSGSTEVSVGSDPSSVAVGDFNGDGIQDIAAASEGSDTVSIRLGAGLGGFYGSNMISVGAFPRSVAVGDFNGDGRQDIATANYFSNRVSIRLGDGLGGFSGATEVGVGIRPISLAVGDFNGDGIQDIAAANYNSSNTVSIRLGDGLGGFIGPHPADVSVGSNPASVAVGDFNGDGIQDIVAANSDSNTVSIRLGDGSGGFSGSTEVSVGSNPISVAVGDFNGDGRQDIAAANEGSNTVSIRLGDGDGGFSGSTDVGLGTEPVSVAVGDFNGDGRQDIAVANFNSNTVSIRLGTCTIPSPPTVTSVVPNSGSTAGGTAVTITGDNFTGATGVTFGGNAATSVVVVNDTTITAVTPSGPAGTASVLVTTSGGTNAPNTFYTYVAEMGTFSFNSAPYVDNETNSDHDFIVTVQRTGGSDGNFGVNVATSAGTATPGSDYTETSCNLVFSDGDASDEFCNIPIKGDTDYEGNETIILTLTPGPGAPSIGSPNPTTLTLINDDAPPATLVVNTTADTDDGFCLPLGFGNGCSLREAINAANDSNDLSTIEFDIPGGGVKNIAPTSPLPFVIHPTIIDGYTQSDATPNSLAVGSDAVIRIEVDGTNAGATFGGIQLGSTGSTVRGLSIIRWSAHGLVLLGGGSAHTVTGNFFGLDASGTTAAPNGGTGLFIDSPGNEIGGNTPASRNVISGNINNGIDVNLPDNSIRGNYIGTDVSGTLDLGNSQRGIGIGAFAASVQIGGPTSDERNVISGNQVCGVDIGTDGNTVVGNFIGIAADGITALGNDLCGVRIFSADNIIGGATAGERNVISGNLGNGIDIVGPNATNNSVLGNFIGTDVSGTLDRGNLERGVILSQGASGNQIGSSAPGAGNVISGNDFIGLVIVDENTANNVVQGNLIGTDATGTSALGNEFGVTIEGAANTAGNVIGGILSGQRNTIANSVQAGVGLNSPGATSNPIRGNLIYSNGGLGIDLGLNGVTANDDLDADSGPNNLQNFPVITLGHSSAGTGVIAGTLNTTANSPSGYFVDFYSNTSCDPSGHGEGETYLGSLTTSVTDANGDVLPFTFNTGSISAGAFITATATDAVGNTSEFSQCFSALDSADTPWVTNAVTVYNVQTTSGLVISRNAADGPEVTHFKITNIQNGSLFLNDGTTSIVNGQFITFAQGNAGLKFTPNLGFIGTGHFTVQASVSNSDLGLGGGTAVADIQVNKAGTTTSITSDLPDPSSISQTYTVVWNVAVVAPGIGTPTGTVSVTDGVDACDAPVGNGSCDITSTTPGSRLLVATYSGDDFFSGSVSADEPHFVCVSNPIVTTNADGGPGSLRQAVIDACPGSMITFGNGSTDFTDATPDTITLDTGEIAINKGLTIDGPTGAELTVSGNMASRVFYISPGNTVFLNRMTIANGSVAGVFPAGIGGGIYNDESTLTLNNMIVRNNASEIQGGGISTRNGNLTVNFSTIRNNTSGSGGGISSRKVLGPAVNLLTINNSTISENTATGGGGGIRNDCAGLGSTANIINSTISGNTAASGGGIDNSSFNCPATLNLYNSTVAGNTGTDNGGGIRNIQVSGSAVVNLSSTIVADNTAPDEDDGPDILNGTGTLGGSYNLVETTTGYAFGSGSNNVFNEDPMLADLADNGGPTETHALLQGSPAIDKGFCFACGDPPNYDQRGVGFDRTVDNPSIENAVDGDGTDIGAYELNTIATSTSLTSTGSPTVFGQMVTFTATVATVPPNGAPTGSVSFFDGANPIAACQDVELVSGQAQCAVSNLTTGGHTITAEYAENLPFTESSDEISHMVNQAATTLQITSDSPDPSFINQAYAVNWTVNVVAPGAGTPAGSVLVSDGTGGNCSAPVGDGTCSITSTTPGTKTITATYVGDGNFTGSSDTESHLVIDPTVCTPTLTITEVFPGSINGFTSVTAGVNSITIDVVNNGAGLQNISVISSTNANISIPSFPFGTFNPVTVTYTLPNPGQPVDFTIRASARSSALLIRAQCSFPVVGPPPPTPTPTPTPSPTPTPTPTPPPPGVCTPTLTLTEVNPGSLAAFEAITAGSGTVTVDMVDTSIGLLGLTLVNASNANVSIPAFPLGTTAPVTTTFTRPNPALPLDFTIRAGSRVNAVLIRAQCPASP